MWDDAYWVRLGELREICNAASGGMPWRRGEVSGSDWGGSVQVFDRHGRQVATCGGDILLQCQWNASFIAAASEAVPRLIDDLGKMHELVDGQHEEIFDRLITLLEAAEKKNVELETELNDMTLHRDQLLLQRDRILRLVRAALEQGSIRLLQELADR